MLAIKINTDFSQDIIQNSKTLFHRGLIFPSFWTNVNLKKSIFECQSILRSWQYWISTWSTFQSSIALRTQEPWLIILTYDRLSFRNYQLPHISIWMNFFMHRWPWPVRITHTRIILWNWHADLVLETYCWTTRTPIKCSLCLFRTEWHQKVKAFRSPSCWSRV